MKKVTTGAAVIVFVFLLVGCSMRFGSPGKSGSAPGQVKKTTGSQSAKPYAPGQKKK